MSAFADPRWRIWRARRAARVARRNRHARLLAEATQYPTKAAAYAAGYRQGYTTAMRWWQWRARKLAKAG